eukprot:scaffold96784_cov66-Phaeocystis_antarctica.AAC.4
MQMTTALPAAASNEEDDEEEETCPVCYEPDNPAAAGDTPTSVACEVCKHAVCGECDSMLTLAGQVQCPMCRAPRRPRALPFSMCQQCRLCCALARLLRLLRSRLGASGGSRHPRRKAGPQGAQPLP